MNSTVPAVLDVLVARWSAALPGVQICDGPPLDIENDVLVVGFIDVPGEAVVASVRTREQMASQPDREIYDISCIASAYSGVGDFKTVRDRVYELCAAVDADVAADPTLDGLVMQARLSTQDLIQEQTEQGAVATVRFAVHIDAFTR